MLVNCSMKRLRNTAFFLLCVQQLDAASCTSCYSFRHFSQNYGLTALKILGTSRCFDLQTDFLLRQEELDFSDAGGHGECRELSYIAFEGMLYHVLAWSSHPAKRAVCSTHLVQNLAKGETIDDRKMLVSTLLHVYGTDTTLLATSLNSSVAQFHLATFLQSIYIFSTSALVSYATEHLADFHNLLVPSAYNGKK